jgi:hypothetical protein
MGGVCGKGTPEPEDKISVIYGFSGSYSQAFSLEQEKGYWVKITEECEFTVSAEE